MIIGLMRFSVLSQTNRNNWRLTRGRSLDQAAADLFAPRRMDVRLKMLNAIPMASLDGQTDRDFRLIVMASSLIPEPEMERLREIVGRRRYAELHLVGPDEAITQAAIQAIGPHDAIQTTFRLDDDDGVNRHFIADLRAATTHGNLDQIISHPNGRYFGRIGDDLAHKAVRIENNAQGLAFCSRAGRTIYDAGSHNKLAGQPMVLIERPDAWLRSIHSASDSRAGLGDPPVELASPTALAMDGYPRFNFPVIANIFARAQQVAPKNRHLHEVAAAYAAGVKAGRAEALEEFRRTGTLA